MRFFYQQYELGNYHAIKGLFHLDSRAQIDALHDYLDDMITDFLTQGSTYDNIVFGSLMQKALNQSLAQLERVLPLEVTARWFAQ